MPPKKPVITAFHANKQLSQQAAPDNPSNDSKSPSKGVSADSESSSSFSDDDYGSSDNNDDDTFDGNFHASAVDPDILCKTITRPLKAPKVGSRVRLRLDMAGQKKGTTVYVHKTLPGLVRTQHRHSKMKKATTKYKTTKQKLATLMKDTESLMDSRYRLARRQIFSEVCLLLPYPILKVCTSQI